MLPFLSLFALTQTFGLFVLLHLMRSAPEGYENETGFHFAPLAGVRSNRSQLH